MNKKFHIPELETKFIFRRQPVAIPGDLRTSYRIALIALLLKNCCRGGKSTLKRLHVLNWGVSSAENRRVLLKATKGEIDPDSIIVRFDPFLNRAMDFALGDGLIQRSGGDKVELTTKGRAFAEAINKDDGILNSEKEFMRTAKQEITEAMVNSIFNGTSQ